MVFGCRARCTPNNIHGMRLQGVVRRSITGTCRGTLPGTVKASKACCDVRSMMLSINLIGHSEVRRLCVTGQLNFCFLLLRSFACPAWLIMAEKSGRSDIVVSMSSTLSSVSQNISISSYVLLSLLLLRTTLLTSIHVRRLAGNTAVFQPLWCTFYQAV